MRAFGSPKSAVFVVVICLLLQLYNTVAFLSLTVVPTTRTGLVAVYVPKISPFLLKATNDKGDNDEDDQCFAVIVKAMVEPDRMAEFLQMIENNAKETRKEPGCLRFDVLRSQETPNEFFFYELYKNEAALDYHKRQNHYSLWAEFKANGGVLESTTYKMDAEFLTG